MNSQVPQIFSERRRRARYQRALARQQRPDAARWLLEALAEDVIERLGFLRWEGGSALFSGLGSEAVATALGKPLTNRAIDFAQPLAGGPCDLIVSLGELDTVNDLPGALIHLRHALAPGGLLIATMLGAGSVPQLRAAMLAGDGERPAARIHPQIESRAMSGLLQRAGFSRQVVDGHSLEVRYTSFGQLIDDLRDQQQSCVLADQALGLDRQGLQRAQAAFAAAADEGGKTSECFEIITLTAWKD